MTPRLSCCRTRMVADEEVMEDKGVYVASPASLAFQHRHQSWVLQAAHDWRGQCGAAGLHDAGAAMGKAVKAAVCYVGQVAGAERWSPKSLLAAACHDVT